MKLEKIKEILHKYGGVWSEAHGGACHSDISEYSDETKNHLEDNNYLVFEDIKIKILEDEYYIYLIDDKYYRLNYQYDSWTDDYCDDIFDLREVIPKEKMVKYWEEVKTET